MCGIFAYISSGYHHPYNIIKNQFQKGFRRGPESSTFITIGKNFYLGFHRLAINGLNKDSDQPFYIDGIYLICNGEIYNYRTLYELLPETIKLIGDSDCEVIIHLYKVYGFEYLLNLLDGVFSLVLYDSNNSKMYVARDPYGVRPLYTLETFGTISGKKIVFASELKQLIELNETGSTIGHFAPGTFREYRIENNKGYCFDDYLLPILVKDYMYTSFGFSKTFCNTIEEYYSLVYNGLKEAVRKRIIGTTNRKVACLLSGGLDSSIVTALASTFLPFGSLETFSIGLPHSVDLVYAKMVADHINTNHVTIKVSEEDFFNAIPIVIKDIESYDTTTVRASVGNYLLGDYISKNSTAKVILNGDGSDELTGGYLYFNSAPDSTEFDRECKRLLKDIHAFDVLRSDKCISTHGLEPRTPFLDRGFVQMYLSIPIDVRCHSINNEPEKNLLRKSIEYMNPSLLPHEVLWRRKEAFSDGVSSHDRSWYQIINEKTKELYLPNTIVKNNFNKPITQEMKYYRMIFNDYYPDCEQVVPYFWMPKYTNATDPSARTIKEYQN